MQLFETKRRTPSINLAALIDILFLLIIFFIVSSRIIGESGVKLVLPYDKRKSSVAAEMPVLSMSANEQLIFQGKPVQEKELSKILRILKDKKNKGSLLMNIDRKVSHGSGKADESGPRVRVSAHYFWNSVKTV